MDFVKQLTSPGKSSPTTAASDSAKAATAEGGSAPHNTPAATASTSAPAVGSTVQDDGDTTLGHVLGKTLSEVRQGGGVGKEQLEAYGEALGTLAAREGARAPQKSAADLGRDAVGETWDDSRGAAAKGGAKTAETRVEALRDDGAQPQHPRQPKDKGGAPANKPVTRSTTGLGDEEDADDVAGGLGGTKN